MQEGDDARSTTAARAFASVTLASCIVDAFRGRRIQQTERAGGPCLAGRVERAQILAAQSAGRRRPSTAPITAAGGGEDEGMAGKVSVLIPPFRQG